jgi:hypothetical protein
VAYQAATAGAGHAEALSQIIASGQWNVSFVTESAAVRNLPCGSPTLADFTVECLAR